MPKPDKSTKTGGNSAEAHAKRDAKHAAKVFQFAGTGEREPGDVTIVSKGDHGMVFVRRLDSDDTFEVKRDTLSRVDDDENEATG